MKIRELLNSELDDGLLDDDNASFSSHDLRSSGYSRDTPISADFSEQAPQTIFNGQDAKTIIPSERGAFERPPLITQRAFHFINGSGQNQDLNQPYNYNTGHQYENHYDDQGYYNHYREQESPHDGQVNGYNQNYDHGEGGVNSYRTSPDDDVDEGFEQYSSYNPPQAIQGQAPLQQDSYHDYNHPQPRYPGSNFDEGNDSSGGHDFNEDYRGYTDEGSQGPAQNIYDNAAESVHANDQNHYRIDTPGNYRVQYHGQQEAFPHISDRGSDRHVKEKSEIANGFSEDGAQDIAQLQILYKARGRKLEDLTWKLQNLEEEMAKEIQILNHHNAMMKGTHNIF